MLRLYAAAADIHRKKRRKFAEAEGENLFTHLPRADREAALVALMRIYDKGCTAG